MPDTSLPDVIADVAQLEELLSRPTPGAIAALRRAPGDVLLLGVAGKMGPTLARMTRRAADAADGSGPRRRVIGVSRFSQPQYRAELEAHGVETIAGDLLDPDLLAALPDAPNVIHLAGAKFGTVGKEAFTWAMNAWLPGLVCRRYRHSRIVAFSTGNVYGLTPVAGPGSRETDALRPCGEYATSCLGRERICEHFSRTCGTPVAMIRLSYAIDLRYGVLVDVGQKVLRGEAVDLAMGYANVIWQGEANALTLCALPDAASPPLALNVTGSQRLAIRAVAEAFAQRFGRTAHFTGSEAADALLSDVAVLSRRYGPPQVDADTMIGWVAHWLQQGGATLNKPTHFEVRSGDF